MNGWWKVRRFDVLEMVLVVVVVVALAVSLLRGVWSNPSMHPEAVALERTYGPGRHSENEEEWIIRDFFQNRREGIFVDVGASHHEIYSNTYFLERTLGWSGLAIEPFTHFEAGYRQERPRTKFLPFFVSDVSGETARMYTHGEKFLGNSSDKTFVERFGADPKEFQAPTSTLNELLESAGIERIDFLSMDIELAEPKALAGFDIRRFSPDLVCIEAHPEVRQQILDYFARHKYVVVAKYLRADAKNLYFTPLH